MKIEEIKQIKGLDPKLYKIASGAFAMAKRYGKDNAKSQALKNAQTEEEVIKLLNGFNGTDVIQKISNNTPSDPEDKDNLFLDQFRKSNREELLDTILKYEKKQDEFITTINQLKKEKEQQPKRVSSKYDNKIEILKRFGMSGESVEDYILHQLDQFIKGELAGIQELIDKDKNK